MNWQERILERTQSSFKYRVCTDSIAKTAGTTKRSTWSKGAKRRYDRCLDKVEEGVFGSFSSKKTTGIVRDKLRKERQQKTPAKGSTTTPEKAPTAAPAPKVPDIRGANLTGTDIDARLAAEEPRTPVSIARRIGTLRSEIESAKKTKDSEIESAKKTKDKATKSNLPTNFFGPGKQNK